MLASLGCQIHSESEEERRAVEQTLLRASGVCQARVAQVEEFNEIPSDGDHWFKVTLKPLRSSGTTLPFLYVVKERGGHLPPEAMATSREGPTVLKHDSLRAGEKHWFIFSNDDDTTKYPPQVAGWWPEKRGRIPGALKEAVRQDRFQHAPQWDSKLNLVYEVQADAGQSSFEVKVREADSLEPKDVLMTAQLVGQCQKIQLSHWNNWPEFETPDDEDFDFLIVDFEGELSRSPSFPHETGTYPQRMLWDPLSGHRLAHWVYLPNSPTLLLNFKQFSPSGDLRIEAIFDFVTREAGPENEDQPEYRKIVNRYERDKVTSSVEFRHLYIHTEQDTSNSSYYWEPVPKNSDEPNP